MSTVKYEDKEELQLSSVTCFGKENDLFGCLYTIADANDITSNYSAAVICQPTGITFYIIYTNLIHYNFRVKLYQW